MTHTSSISSESLLPCSVIIGSHGRREHLLRQLNSILASNELPSELVLVTDDVEHCELTLLKELGIAIQLLPVQWASDETKRFDIGRQREFGASNANEDWLIFLDVDCLVSPTFLGDILSGLQQTKRQTQTLLMGEPYYLPADSEINSWFNNHATNKADHLQQLAKKVLPKAQQQWQQAVTDLAIAHPRRPAVTEFVMPTDDYASFGVCALPCIVWLMTPLADLMPAIQATGQRTLTLRLPQKSRASTFICPKPVLITSNTPSIVRR